MKPSTGRFSLILLLLLSVFSVKAQDETAASPDSMMAEEVDKRPVKDMFGSHYIIDNQTAFVPIKGTFAFDIQHRFGEVSNGYEDFFGLYAPSNIRLGFSYVPVKKLMVGFGITKANISWDFHLKYALLEQTRSNSIPVSLTYFGNAVMDTRDKSFFPDPDAMTFSDRLSFFHQLIVARKFSNKFSLQAGASFTHYNTVFYADAEGPAPYDNDHWAVSVAGRYAITPGTSILVNFDQPISFAETLDPPANFAFGVEFKTSSHQFQFFMGNYYYILPQLNWLNTKERDDDLLGIFNAAGPYHIGFNMVRYWNF
jgi:hypothetical protein